MAGGRESEKHFPYKIDQGMFKVDVNGTRRTFYLRRDGRAVYEVLQDERSGGKKEVYTKQRDR